MRQLPGSPTKSKTIKRDQNTQTNIHQNAERPQLLQTDAGRHLQPKQQSPLPTAKQKANQKQPSYLTHKDTNAKTEWQPSLDSHNTENHASTHAISNTSQTLTRHSQNQSTIRPTKRNGHKPATHKDQQHKTNMENHRSLQRTLLQAETRKTAKNRPSRIVIPKKTAKEFPKHDLQPT
jgi:hypothetical protein